MNPYKVGWQSFLRIHPFSYTYNMKTKKKVKLIDVVHLYVGHQIQSYWGAFKETEVIKGVIGSKVILEIEDDNIFSSIDLSYKQKKGREVKLVLHPMSKLTREELITQGFDSHIDYLTHEQQDPLKAPYEMVQYLIGRGFDVFGLIESNQAISI